MCETLHGGTLPNLVIVRFESHFLGPSTPLVLLNSCASTQLIEISVVGNELASVGAFGLVRYI